MERLDAEIPSHGETLAAWLFLPERARYGKGPHPLVIMAHGLGGVRHLRLPQVAERFTAEGYACLAFDYRYFGDSSGQPRQVLSIPAQLADWESALAWAKQRAEVDPARLVLWGTSLSGGYVTSLAARHPELAGVIAQCPATSGISDGVKKRSAGQILRYARAGLEDLLRGALGLAPRYVPIFGKDRELALLTSANAEKGYQSILKLMPEEADWRQYVGARFVIHLLLYHPIKKASHIRVPLLVMVCDGDQDVDPSQGHRLARLAGGKSVGLPIEHFEIYTPPHFDAVMDHELAFLREHVPVGEAASA
ncbi:MAG: alpha/beta fold hydrolase [Verrucomicrobiota bacterium]